ncbi:MAG TPA: hypothetical protein PLD20_08940 [Blastocatellia bacterium]|nr:hypothetical protein [Blastocatellia bacterium]HMY72021.1 hypothetical protein [Blastocatellia bacterium]HMZ18042.1 hypothetical protein [Blastocatellia bacterium]HNG34650.1 hypothetical protein [Blastocatellia bacterium]
MNSTRHLCAFFSRVLPFVLVLAFLASALTGHAPRVEAEVETGDEKAKADEWFVEQRAYPLKDIPLGARAEAVEQLERTEALRAAELRRLYGAEAAEIIEQSQPKWQPLGPQPISNGNTGTPQRPVSGRATAIALHPNYNGTTNQTLYLGTAQGGIWRTTDNGANWTPIADGEASLAIGSLAIDPTNPNVIYAGTGEGNASGDCYYGAGLLKSTDGGNNWRLISGPLSAIAPQVPAFQGVAIMRVGIDPSNTQTIYLCTRTATTYGPSGGGGITGYAAGQRGVWKSTDGGETWRFLDVAGNNTVVTANDLIFDPQNSSVIYAALNGRGIYRSRNGGDTWQLLAGGLPSANVGRIDLTLGPPIAPSTFATYYAAIANGDGINGIFRSTDNGENWQATPTNPPNIGQAGYNWTFSVDPSDANVMYLGAVNFYRSLDGGATWTTQVNGTGDGGVHVDQHDSTVSRANPNIFFLANDGGIWRTDNAKAATIPWVNLNQTLNTVQFQGVAMHPTNPDFLVGGTQDNGTNRFTGTAAWTRIFGGDGGFALVDQSKPNIVWQSTQNNAAAGTTTASFGPRLSTNGGDSFVDRGCRNCAVAPGRMNVNDRVRFYSPMNLHTGFAEPNNVIYWGTQRVYRSPDLGVTWTGLGPSADGFGQDLSKGAGTVTVMTAHPKLDNSTTPPGEIVWVGTSDGNVQVTTNAGKLAEAAFTNVTKAPLPNRFITDIAMSPANTNRAYVVYSGFNLATPTTPGHVFVTDNQGASWRDISGDLPDVPVTSVAVDPMIENSLFIGTDIGVFQTTNGGANWVRLSNGMPRVASFMVRYHAATRSIVVATHGRGMFRLNLPDATTTVSAASFSRSALALESIVAAFGNNLATATQAATTLPLPTQLAGTTVRLTDSAGVEHLAPLFFVSPGQVNYLMPAAVAPGNVSVKITSGNGATAFGLETVSRVAPALFTANASGRGVPAAQAVRVRNGTLTYFPVAQFDSTGNQFVPAEIDLGPATDQVVLALYGSGVRRRSNLSAVRVTVGGVALPADYASEAPGFTGLDQINVLLPRTLIGRGEVDVTVVVDGLTANTVRIRIK